MNNLLIAGDLVPINNDLEYFKKGDLKQLMGEELLKIWSQSEHRIFNLETPLVNNGSRIKKYGPNLKADEDTIIGIKQLNPDLITLANNHIMDFGVEGLENTIKILDKNGIKYIGVGKNCEETDNYEILTMNNKKIAIYNCCEHEFSVATNTCPGANGYNENTIYKEINDIKNKVDYLIIIFHGGKEHYRYPSPGLQSKCRSLVDAGADIIICQHSHCIGCFENYNNCSIIYGQGNFIFNYNDNECWNTSLIVNVILNDKIDIEYIPIVKEVTGIRLADKEEKEIILKQFYDRSDNIKKDGFIKDEYNKFAKKEINNYLTSMHGSNLLFRIINKITSHKFVYKMYNEKDLMRMLNMIECEAHRELFIQGLKDIIRKG